MKSRHVSEAVIRRLPKYYRQLQALKTEGIERISSGELSKRMGLNASQIRQDFNCFGGFGQQGYGYGVDSLLNEIGSILGLNKKYSAVIVGVGNIGKALIRYSGFDKEGFSIVGAFDVNSELFGRQYGDVTVQDISYLNDFLQKSNIDIGIICTQNTSAQQVCDNLVEGGVKAIWNYAPINVIAKHSIAVENIHLSDYLYVLSYRLNNPSED